MQSGTFISAISTRYSGKIHKKYRNKTLEKIILPYTYAFFISGIILLMNRFIGLNKFIAVLMIIITFVCKGPYYVLIKKYLKNFTNFKKRTQISGAKIFIEDFITGLCLLYASIASKFIYEGYIVAFFGVQFLVLFIFVLRKSKMYVGKKPEEYSKKELMQD